MVQSRTQLLWGLVGEHRQNHILNTFDVKHRIYVQITRGGIQQNYRMVHKNMLLGEVDGEDVHHSSVSPLNTNGVEGRYGFTLFAKYKSSMCNSRLCETSILRQRNSGFSLSMHFTPVAELEFKV